MEKVSEKGQHNKILIQSAGKGDQLNPPEDEPILRSSSLKNLFGLLSESDEPIMRPQTSRYSFQNYSKQNKGNNRSKNYSNFKGNLLMKGEKILYNVESVAVIDEPSKAMFFGEFCLTEYRILWVPYPDDPTLNYFISSIDAISIPLNSIWRFDKFGRTKIPQDGQSKYYGLEVTSKIGLVEDFYFPIEVSEKIIKLIADIQKEIIAITSSAEFPFSKKFRSIFINTCKLNSLQNSNNNNEGEQTKVLDLNLSSFTGFIDGWKVYEEEKEFSRQGINLISSTDSNLSSVVGWRLSTINETYELCEGYPAKLCIPACVSDETLQLACTCRSHGRIPVVTWHDSTTGAIIARSAQPLLGLINSLESDKKLIAAFREALSPETSAANLTILDLRPRLNAEVNRLVKGGYEKDYLGCQLHFLNLPNVHKIKESYMKLLRLLHEEIYFFNYYNRLMASEWLQLLLNILQAARIFAGFITSGISVLCHCRYVSYFLFLSSKKKKVF